MIKEIKLPSYFRMYPNVFNEHQINSFLWIFSWNATECREVECSIIKQI